MKQIIFLALSIMLITGQTQAADKLTVILDWFVNPNHGPIIVAQNKGFFADQGLEVEIIAPADPADPPKMVAAGSADLAVSYQPQLHLQVAAGLPLMRVGTLIATPLSCLLVKADGPVRTIADLKGRKIGFSVGGLDDAMLGAMLANAGLSLADVEMVNVNWALSPSVMSGQVDAVTGAFRNFELTQMRIEGVKGRCFYYEEEGVPPYDELIYVANAKTMKRDAIRRFLAATELATQYMINHPAESWEAFKQGRPELDDELNRTAWTDTLPRFALRPSALDPGRYVRFAKFLRAHDVIKTIPPLGAYAVDLNAE